MFWKRGGFSARFDSFLFAADDEESLLLSVSFLTVSEPSRLSYLSRLSVVVSFLEEFLLTFDDLRSLLPADLFVMAVFLPLAVDFVVEVVFAAFFGAGCWLTAVVGADGVAPMGVSGDGVTIGEADSGVACGMTVPWKRNDINSFILTNYTGKFFSREEQYTNSFNYTRIMN